MKVVPASSAFVSSLSFWEKTWAKVRGEAFLSKSQTRHPRRWSAFYDRVAESWSAMTGERKELEERIVEELFTQGAIGSGQKALELGCGPGDYSLLLSERGVKVTALDASAAMVEVLRKRAQVSGIRGLKILHKDWEDLPPRSRFHLVLAAGFPQVLSPSGIARLESFSRTWCALILGSGDDPFPFRIRLWKRIMGVEPVQRKSSLLCLIHYLWLSGRRPHFRPFDQEVTLSIPEEQAVVFYREYFSIFSKKGEKTERAIREVLSPFLHQGRIRCRGKREVVLVFWKKVLSSSVCRKNR